MLGWQRVLAKKWDVDPRSVYKFVKKYALDLLQNYQKEMFAQRCLDVEEEFRVNGYKNRGWGVRLAKHWGISKSSVSSFVKKYVVDAKVDIV